MQYARFRATSRFYNQPQRSAKPYGVPVNAFTKLTIKPELKGKLFIHETVDFRKKESLEQLEAIRHPRERDFYQDHTYHNQWVQREADEGQKRALTSRYRFFAKNFQINPWIWHPGDMVEIVSGEHIGQRGTIIAVIPYQNQIVVQNVNVQEVVIPATETRPEQCVQREHQIPVRSVRHVDPSTNALCDVRLVTVKNKTTGKQEERRMSLASGVLLPIPPRDDQMELGDPLKDTPILDADELTFNAAKELPLLVERKLQAMENHVVAQLKQSFEHHDTLAAANEASMRAFQRDVADQTIQRLAERLAAGEMSLAGDWMQDDVAQGVAALQEEEIEAARERAEEEAKTAAASQMAMRRGGEESDDADEADGSAEGQSGSLGDNAAPSDGDGDGD